MGIFISAHNSLGMVAASVLSQIGDGNENSPSDSPHRQTLRRHKVVEPTLANGQKLRGLFAAHQQFVFKCDSNPLWMLPAITLQRWLLRRRLQSASIEIK
jgi:hypothetical protein